MSPSPYPVLNNKPIDQWKVTELKEELKRRRLPLRGLKDELVRRLDEALREEMNTQLEEEQEVEEEEQVETPPIHSGYTDDMVVDDDLPVQQEETEVKEALPVQQEEVEVKEYPPVQREVEVKEDPPVQQEVEVKEDPPVQQEVEVKEDPPVQQEEVEVKEDPPVQQEEVEVKEASLVQLNQIETVEDAPPLKKESTESDPEEELEKPLDAPEVIKAENSDAKMVEREDIQTQTEELKIGGVGMEPVHLSVPLDEIPQKDMKGAEEVKPDQAKPNEQVSQVGPATGSQVKCESISSTESFKCINVENKLKDNLNADNFDLEKQVEVKQDIQDDKNKQPVKNQADTSSLEGQNYENTPSNNVNSIVGADSGSPEKLNLDRSSGDDSMEEDLTESSKPLVDSVGGGAQDMVKEEVNSDSAPADTDKMDIAASVEEVRPAVAASEKRKLEGSFLFLVFSYMLLLKLLKKIHIG
jgi:apoptotic chromatin condensation inducer in the nucleus